VHSAGREKKNKIQTPRRRRRRRLRPTPDCNRLQPTATLPVFLSRRLNIVFASFRVGPESTRVCLLHLSIFGAKVFLSRHFQTPVTSSQHCVLVEQILVTGTVDRPWTLRIRYLRVTQPSSCEEGLLAGELDVLVASGTYTAVLLYHSLYRELFHPPYDVSARPIMIISPRFRPSNDSGCLKNLCFGRCSAVGTRKICCAGEIVREYTTYLRTTRHFEASCTSFPVMKNMLIALSSHVQ
jgi:hypothetical protein